MELTIDDRTIEANRGESVLHAAMRHGIEIPHFCYHPRLSIAGNCRICLVKVEGVPKLMPACNLSVASNMKVSTLVPEVGRARQQVMQFLMLNHPVDCGICDKAGECRLQDYEYAYGLPRSRSTEAKHRKRKLYDLSPRIQLDNERCILCSRCVRFTREISKSNMLGIVERGAHAFVERLDPKSGVDPYSDNVIGLCPTGALLSRDFLYQSRVWFLEPVRSVCTGCSRGCSIDLWRRKKEWRLRALGEERNSLLYRVTAHENPEINGSWLCNKGFDQHKLMARERALTPMLDGAPITIEEALAHARDLISQSRTPAALVSALASNEELDVFKTTLGARFHVYAREDSVPQPGEVIEDDFLIKADKNPNSYGVRERFGWKTFTAEEARAHDLFLVWGDWGDYEGFGRARVIHLTSFARERDRHADVHIPLSTTFERSGTFCNFEGKRNRFERVLDKPPLVQHAADVFAQLEAELAGLQRLPGGIVIPDLVVHGAFMLYAITFMMLLATVFTWVERKQSAIMSDRIGANRCYIRLPFTNIKFVAWGLFHGIADGGKLLLKENFTPLTYDRLCYNLAPWLAAVPVLLVFAVVPFGGTLAPGRLVDADTFPSLAAALQGFFGERSYTMQVAGLDAGLLFVLAISGLGVLGTMLAGWSSNNKFSLMGASRAASQMISYEVAMGLALISMVVTYGTLDLNAMVKWQSQLLVGVLPAWGLFVQPLAFIFFLTASIAENKRIPFDLPEAESELVAGYFTEYTAMKMGLFMLSEFIEIVVISALVVTLFLGGYNLPYMTDEGFAFPGGATWSLSHAAVVVLQVGTFAVKTFIVGCFQIQVRWTLPRFRYDQLMTFGWKVLLPLAAVNLVVTVLLRWVAL